MPIVPCQPSCGCTPARMPTPTSPRRAQMRRTSMRTAGERSRTPTLMKRYDEPQIAPRTTRRKTYRRLKSPSGTEARLNHLTQVAEQPLHRALGLTDREADRIRELLGR